MIRNRTTAVVTIAMLLTNPGLAQLSFGDITLAAGTSGPMNEDDLGGHGAMFAEVDRDGRPDLYITMIVSKSMDVLHFGLGARTPVDMVVRFRDGSTRVLRSATTRQTVVAEMPTAQQ